MLIIGLTGATGAGKGEFSAYAVEKYGALHIDTDRLARQVVEKGKPAWHEIVKTFGKGVLQKDGTLDRAALASIVFADKEKLETLNHITHSHILAEATHMIDEARANGTPITILDAPLLFESGAETMCDVTLGVIADEAVRKARIMARDGITEEMADARLRNAKSADYFTARCDHILENNSPDLAVFRRDADALIGRLLAPNKETYHA